jgi:hypothetical protein
MHRGRVKRREIDYKLKFERDSDFSAFVLLDLLPVVAAKKKKKSSVLDTKAT